MKEEDLLASGIFYHGIRIAVKITIGTRQSALARIQSELIGEELKKNFPSIDVEYYYKKTEGDIDQSTPLSKLSDRGVFTQDLSSLLINNKIDVAVHSWKDYPTEGHQGTEIISTIKRADSRDMLLIRKDSWNKIRSINSINVLSSSPRREYNVSSFLKWALPCQINKTNFISVRGNIETRINKLLEGQADALIIAKAAIDRILTGDINKYSQSIYNVRNALSKCYWSIIPLSANPSAAGQGALAIEVATHRKDIKEIFLKIIHKETLDTIFEERKILKSYGGGCQQKIGATIQNFPFGKITFLAGETLSGQKLNSINLNTNQKLPPKTSIENVCSYDELQKLFSYSFFSINYDLYKDFDLWVSKSQALPDNWHPSFDTVIYCAGLDTWKKLALRGIWVNGSAESLGENIDPAVTSILQRNPKWLKLTHQDASASNIINCLATYKLNQDLPFPDLTCYTHFYWKSAYLFKLAIKHNPEILSAWHGCGVGNTYNEISSLLPDTSKLSIWLNYNDWIKYVVK